MHFANLQGATLPGANLQDASLPDADLQRANLLGANLRFADLLGADLHFANLLGADLRAVQWGNTICPDGTNSNNHGDTGLGYLTPRLTPR
jgi:uncharacterized protein YjbI with pentapeptide repeats